MALPQYFSQKIFSDREELAIQLQKNYQGKSLVFTNGCFDVLHPGHVLYLYQARQLGDCLVVGLNSDASVRRLKGDARPIHPWNDRALLLVSLVQVDFVLYFNEDTPEASIKALRPKIHCKGGDYNADDLVETPLVKKLGGYVHILPFAKGHSTTKLIKQIKGKEL